jgi:hypothetical protein
MLHACVQKFYVTGNFEKFCKILGTQQALSRFDFFGSSILLSLDILLYLEAYQNGCTKKVKATYNLERWE